MWVVIETKTKKEVLKAATYKQCLNYLKDKKTRGCNDQYKIKVV